MGGPLEGIRIIDWTIWQQGPVASAMLADLGAEVIKIEERERGDPGRGIMTVAGIPVNNGLPNFYHEANNRHKKSLAVNLKTRQGREIIYRLAEKSDVFLQNFRKGVAERLELDYPRLRACNPRLIYANATGYGPEGAESGEPSFDYLGEARSGIMLAVGTDDDTPSYIFGGVADQMGAIMLAHGIVVALFARERLGIGQEIHASHLGSMIALQGLNVACRAMMGTQMTPRSRRSAFNPLWNHYRCADGKWLCLGMLQSERYWSDFCRVMGLDRLIEDPRFATIASRGENAAALVEILDRAFAQRPRDEWLKKLREGGDFVATIVNSVDDLPDDPQVIANGYIVDYNHPKIGPTKIVGLPLKFSATPGDPYSAAPELGEHTEEILNGLLGYTWDEIGRLKEQGVI
jgi:crotonobetainyl-CoA:carnitine CoA-transferase CaiB-like acyl-CoA transferase